MLTAIGKWSAFKRWGIVFVCGGTTLFPPSVSHAFLGRSSGTIEEQRADVRSMAQETLNQLYAIRPEARAAIQRAVGYAVFSNFGMKFLWPAAD